MVRKVLNLFCYFNEMKPGVKTLSPHEFDRKVTFRLLGEVWPNNNFNHREIFFCGSARVTEWQDDLHAERDTFYYKNRPLSAVARCSSLSKQEPHFHVWPKIWQSTCAPNDAHFKSLKRLVVDASCPCHRQQAACSRKLQLWTVMWQRLLPVAGKSKGTCKNSRWMWKKGWTSHPLWWKNWKQSRNCKVEALLGATVVPNSY